MSILFSNFAVEKETNFSPPETRIIGNKMAKTIYIYKGKKISHLAFISLCRNAGLTSGFRCSHYDHLVDMAFKGNSRAVEILNELQVINPNEKEIFDHADEI